jgi:hypothetical protein
MVKESSFFAMYELFVGDGVGGGLIAAGGGVYIKKYRVALPRAFLVGND